MASAQDIVQAAYELMGAPYRPWRSGNSIPMWQDDDEKATSGSLSRAVIALSR